MTVFTLPGEFWQLGLSHLPEPVALCRRQSCTESEWRCKLRRSDGGWVIFLIFLIHSPALFSSTQAWSSAATTSEAAGRVQNCQFWGQDPRQHRKFTLLSVGSKIADFASAIESWSWKRKRKLTSLGDMFGLVLDTCWGKSSIISQVILRGWERCFLGGKEKQEDFWYGG